MELKNLKKKKKKKKDKKVTIMTLAFPTNNYEKIKSANRLSTITQDLLHLKNKFGRKHNLKKDVTLHFVEDQPQKTETDTCGIFKSFHR